MFKFIKKIFESKEKSDEPCRNHVIVFKNDSEKTVYIDQFDGQVYRCGRCGWEYGKNN